MADGDRLRVNSDMVETFERVYFGRSLNVGVRQALQAVFDEFNLSAGAAAGDRLDAERRGDPELCAHAGIHYFDDEIGRSRCARCEAVVGPDRGQEQADMLRENGSV